MRLSWVRRKALSVFFCAPMLSRSLKLMALIAATLFAALRFPVALPRFPETLTRTPSFRACLTPFGVTRWLFFFSISFGSNPSVPAARQSARQALWTAALASGVSKRRRDAVHG